MAEADIMPIEATGEEHLPATAGAKLRAAREAMGLTRADICAITKINERHLQAVEDGEFSALPARIYATGFARSYAGAVGLDAQGIAAEVRRELELQDNPHAARPAYDLDLEDPAKVPSKTLAWVAAAAAIALVVAGAVFWRSYFVPAVDLPPVREEMVAAAADTPAMTPAALVSPTAESAAGLPSPLDPVPAAAAARAARAPRPSGVAPAAAGVQAPPRPQPEKLEPLPQAATPAAEPATPPAAAPVAGDAPAG